MELVGITRLSASAIVRGKLLAALVQSLLYTVALLPFLSFSFLMRGIDVLTICVLLGAAIVVAVWSTNLALFLASLVPNRIVRWLIGAILSMSLVFGVGTTTGLTFAIVQFRIFDNVLADILRRDIDCQRRFGIRAVGFEPSLQMLPMPQTCLDPVEGVSGLHRLDGRTQRLEKVSALPRLDASCRRLRRGWRRIAGRRGRYGRREGHTDLP